MCTGNSGQISIRISLSSGQAEAKYSVSIAGFAARSGTVNPNGQASEIYSGLADGSYAVTVSSADGVIAAQTIDIMCES